MNEMFVSIDDLQFDKYTAQNNIIIFFFLTKLYVEKSEEVVWQLI